MQYLLYALIGVASGIMSGFFGIGGGIIIIPLLVLLLGYDQLKAQGTSLGILLAPIGVFGFLQYWNNPNIKMDVAAIVAIALFFAGGALVGGKLANSLDVTTMRKVFALFLVVVGVYQFFRKVKPG
jgi:uncharacterized membrane protein YfcA